MHGCTTSRIRLGAIAGCIAVTSLAVAGCGGGSSSSSTGASGASGPSGASGSAPLTKTELVAQANAICKEANSKVEALPALTDSTVVSSTAKLVAAGQAELAKQEALTPPSDLQSDWNDFIAGLKGTQALLQKELDAMQAGNKSEIAAVVKQLGAPDASYAAAISSLGLTECAKSPTPQG